MTSRFQGEPESYDCDGNGEPDDAKGRRGQVTDVMGRVAALSAALDCGGPWLPPEVVRNTRDRMEHVGHRLDLGTERTVVALVGATGSGKSSLFNAIARMDIAPVGVRRPLTTSPMACVWGELGSEALLDWLKVPDDRRLTRESVLDADDQVGLHGLVLLDLPDHDSTEAVHRIEVDRLVRMVDLMIWVVDPQKYADNALHAGYLQKLTSHDGVMLVVLNQVDKLRAEEIDACVTDLRRLLDGDGLARVGIVPVSAVRGDGVDELRALLADVVEDRFAVIERIESDLDIAAEEVAGALAAAEPGDGTPVGRSELIDELASAAGVPALLDVLSAEYRRKGKEKLGWAPADWLGRIVRSRRSEPGQAETTLKAETSSLKALASPAQRPAVHLAVEGMLAKNAGPLPERWSAQVRSLVARAGDPTVSPADAVLPSSETGIPKSVGPLPGDSFEDASYGRGRHTPAYGISILAARSQYSEVPDPDGLARVLDARLAAVDLRFTAPFWWRLIGAAQQVLGAIAVIGLVWSVVLGLGRLVGAGLPGVFGSGPAAVGTLAVGLLFGVALKALSGWWLAAGARNRRETLDGRLHEAVTEVATQRVVEPISSVLARHRQTRQVLLGERDPGGTPGKSVQTVDGGRPQSADQIADSVAAST